MTSTWVYGIACVTGVLVAAAGTLMGNVMVFALGPILLGAMIVPLGLMDTYRTAKRDARIGQIARERGETLPSVSDALRNYPYQNVVYGTAASEVMQLRNEEKDREWKERIKRP
jgi:hypothetical protein